MKLILMPCTPNSQSSGPSVSWKSERRVRLHDREFKREAGMGLKRVSSKADVRAYWLRPDSRGRGVKVPIQPRRCFW